MRLRVRIRMRSKLVDVATKIYTECDTNQCLPNFVTQPRKLTIFGCLSSPRDFPSSISCSRLCLSVTELVSCGNMKR